MGQVIVHDDTNRPRTNRHVQKFESTIRQRCRLRFTVGKLVFVGIDEDRSSSQQRPRVISSVKNQPPRYCSGDRGAVAAGIADASKVDIRAILASVQEDDVSAFGTRRGQRFIPVFALLAAKDVAGAAWKIVETVVSVLVGFGANFVGIQQPVVILVDVDRPACERGFAGFSNRISVGVFKPGSADAARQCDNPEVDMTKFRGGL